jgi:hypothetical protein
MGVVMKPDVAFAWLLVSCMVKSCPWDEGRRLPGVQYQGVRELMGAGCHGTMRSSEVGLNSV